MIYAGFFIEILNANPGNPIKITLVSPDPANQQLAQDCSPKVNFVKNKTSERVSFQLEFPGSDVDQPKLQVDSLGRTLSRLLEQVHQNKEGGL